MPSNLTPTGMRLTDTADILLLDTPKVSTINVTAGTLAAGNITGGDFVVLITTNATPGTQTTRTALQMYGDDPTAAIPGGYVLRICNSGAGTLTLGAGAGVTLTGTMTVATATFRDFAVVYGGTPGAPTVTITNIGLGTYS